MLSVTVTVEFNRTTLQQFSKMSEMMYNWSAKQTFDKIRYNAMESG